MTHASKLAATTETNDCWDNLGEHTVDDDRFLLSKKLECQRDKLAEMLAELIYVTVFRDVNMYPDMYPDNQATDEEWDAVLKKARVLLAHLAWPAKEQS